MWMAAMLAAIARMCVARGPAFVGGNLQRSLRQAGALAVPKDVPGLEPLRVPEGWQAPEPRPLSATRSSLFLALLGASVALALRLGAGALAQGWRFGTAEVREGRYALALGPLNIRDGSDVIDGKFARPSQPLVLYEYEASPFCRKVREALCILDIPCEMRPCPGARTGFSDELAERTGRRTVPYLIDPSADVEMFESDDIVDYLYDKYGPGKGEVPWLLRDPVAQFTAAFASIARSFAGARPEPGARADNPKRAPLELWGYECSPFVKLVRERLCSLMLPHVVLPCSRGSPRRDEMVKLTGRFQVPYLRDPNTGAELFEMPEILDYLLEVYTVETK